MLIPVLAYHEVVEDGGIPQLAGVLQQGYIVEQSVFERQIRSLAAAGYRGITISELLSWQGSDQKLVCVTFDDGYAGNVRLALPILRSQGFKATFFLTTSWMGKRHMLDWQGAHTLLVNGMEIGSHTRTHPLLGTCTRGIIREELGGSCEDIFRYTGHRTSLLSFPNGSYSALAIAIGQDKGYRAFLTSDFGYVDASAARKTVIMPRIFPANRDHSIQEIIERHPSFLAKSYLKSAATGALKAILGREKYDTLYNRFFNVDLIK